MRRIFTLAMTILFVFAISSMAIAAPLTLVIDGKKVKYTGPTLTLQVNGETVTTAMPPVVIGERTMVPARAFFEKLGADVAWNAKSRKVTVTMNDKKIELKINDKTAVVNKKNVTMDVPAKIINDNTMLPVRFVSEQLGFKVLWNGDKGLVRIDSSIPWLNDVVVKRESGSPVVYIKTDAPIENYSVMDLDSPKRVVVDIKGAENMLKSKEFDVNRDSIYRIRSWNFEDGTRGSRVVLDISGWPGYTSELSADRKSVIVRLNENTSKFNGIKFSNQGGYEGIDILTDSTRWYTASRSTTPEGMLINVPNCSAPEKPVVKNIGGSVISTVEYSKGDNNSLNVRVNTNKQMQFNIERKPGGISVVPVTAPWKNIQYYADGNTCKIYFDGADLTGVLKQNTHTAAKKMIFSVPADAFSSGQGDMLINDLFLEKMTVSRNESSSELEIRINSKDFFVADTSYEKKKGRTVLELKSPPRGDGRLVVIDAGHGGSAPGAIYGGIFEKNLNLDIALRVEKILKKKGVNVLMTRTDDVDVGLYDRADIANEMGASLFLSIHNNANPNLDIDGSMTMYYPGRVGENGFTDERFAEIIHDNMLDGLKANNRRMVSSPQLVVLNSTKMPAVLAEVAFMSNSSDLAKLCSEEFRQQAAEALANGVLQALNEMENGIVVQTTTPSINNEGYPNDENTEPTSDVKDDTDDKNDTDDNN